jgi:Cu2+-exporting ATPase
LLAPLAVAGFACMNVMLLSVSIWSGADGATRDLFHWLSALIGVPAIAYAGRPFFTSAWSALRHGRTNMDVPISIGVTLATALSLYETATGGAEAWFDGTLMLLLFLLAGRALDAMMRDRARAGVDALLRQAAPGPWSSARRRADWRRARPAPAC